MTIRLHLHVPLCKKGNQIQRQKLVCVKAFRKHPIAQVTDFNRLSSSLNVANGRRRRLLFKLSRILTRWNIWIWPSFQTYTLDILHIGNSELDEWDCVCVCVLGRYLGFGFRLDFFLASSTCARNGHHFWFHLIEHLQISKAFSEIFCVNKLQQRFVRRTEFQWNEHHKRFSCGVRVSSLPSPSTLNSHLDGTAHFVSFELMMDSNGKWQQNYPTEIFIGKSAIRKSMRLSACSKPL